MPRRLMSIITETALVSQFVESSFREVNVVQNEFQLIYENFGKPHILAFQ